MHIQVKSWLGALLLAPLFCLAQPEAAWLRYPAISPDGSQIVFTYKGDLYKVAASGGTAMPLTLHEAHDYMPVWSRDGKHIAFASDRYGNFDVFIMPAEGGEAKRLTTHSAGEVPYSFSADGKQVLFGAARLDAAANRQYPTASMPELYSVSVQGGRVQQVLTTPAEEIALNADGSLMLYHDKKGGENVWRKHHTSAITRDIWVYNTRSGAHTQLTRFAGEDRNPVWAPDGKSIFYLSEAGGTFNVYSMQPDGSGSKAVTNFKKHPVRFLSTANNGTLCFFYDGDIYTHNNGQSKKVPVRIAADMRQSATVNQSFSSGVSGMQLSPNGKEVAFIYRGDVFVTNADGSATKQVTQTPEQERDITWHKDGRSLMYASERSGGWKIYQTEIIRKEEPYFFAATLLKETLVAGDAKIQAMNPTLSPDGKLLAYTENLNTLRVRTMAGGQTRTVVSPAEWVSWSDGGHRAAWSPDSRWLVVDYRLPGISNTEVGLVSADGSTKLTNVTLSGFNDGNPKWMMHGEMLLWFSDRDGLSSKANSGGAQRDAYGLFLTRDAWEKFRLTKEEAALAKEMNEKAAKKDTAKKKDSTLTIAWDGLEYRKAKLTIHSSSLSDAVVDKEGEMLYYLARFERGLNLWSTNLRTKETKILAPLNSNSGQLAWDKEGKKLFVQSDGGISKIDPSSGKVDRVAISGDMTIQVLAERENMYDHVWRRTNDIFYKTGFHGVDWAGMGKDYRRFLPHIGNGYEMAELLSELLGELNVSHCGASYGARSSDGDATASLGILIDYAHQGNGLRISEVLPGGPLDTKELMLRPGTIIEAINGDTLTPAVDYAQLLNRQAGKTVLLSLLENGKRREVIVKPVSLGEESQMLYKRWVKRNADEVEKLSNGALGYIHIPGMSDGAYRVALEEAMGKYAGKKALVVDTRNNGGGDLVADLAMWLSGKRFLQYSNDKEVAGYEPSFRWNKPSISLANEGNYSDGHCYAYSYQFLKLGKLVGMPVAGTCTFAGWEMLQEPGLRWGVPPMGVKTMDGRYLENLQTEPDIKVMNEYVPVSSGKDQQLEVAVKELMKEI